MGGLYIVFAREVNLMQIKETKLSFKSGMKQRNKTNRFIIHHTASQDVPASTIHQWHLNQGWSGIGYHFVIRQNGDIERGRAENLIGAHAGEKGNPDSIGIVLTGNFETGKPTTAQMDSLVWLLKDYLFPKYGVKPVIGHKDVMATACPGKNFPWEELRERLEDDEMAVETKIKVNGQVLTGYILKDNRSYAPVRALAEALGAKVDWDDKTKTVIITK
jgi:N-acetyl-anhydromuramyl-L-alanine amidase AmpD